MKRWIVSLDSRAALKEACAGGKGSGLARLRRRGFRVPPGFVVLPQAFRIVLPPLGSQYLNLAKNTSLGIAVAYADIVQIGQTIFNKGGQALAIPVGAGGGLMHGALGASGTVFGSFYHSLRLPRDEFVFALTITFLWFGTLQIGTLAQLGSFGRERVIQSLIAVIPVFVVTPLGERLSRSLNAEVFGRVVLALLATSAVALIVGAFA